MPLRPILDVAADLALDAYAVPWGRQRAKIDLSALEEGDDGGALVLVSALTPTRGGEGKTTVSVGLAMGLARIGVRGAVSLREPSVGPVFGIKGGGTGGGAAQVEPAADINLHFTGDLHAVTSAHNLLAALIDNDLFFGAKSGLAADRVGWPRVLDVNDRALRDVVLRGKIERRSRFDITAASEVMAILCLAESPVDLRRRLSRIVVGLDDAGSPVTAADLRATDAMAALLVDALCPNLAQTREGTPALVHGGPFANIAHGCSSVVATRLALRRTDVTVTEAGFGFDLGGEKFLHLKCRSAGLWPTCVVLVVTVRAIERHGGEGAGALERGFVHLDRQIENVRAFGLEPVVAINVFPDDTDDELRAVESYAERSGVAAARCTAFADGGAGAVQLAEVVMETIERTRGRRPAPRFLYDLDDPPVDKLRAIATTLYGAGSVTLSPAAEQDLEAIVRMGHADLPLCVAKTHLSLSGDPKLAGAPVGFPLEVTAFRVAAGVGFLVALVGDIMTMPGLPPEPAAGRVRIDAEGRIHGLMQNED